jgi:hypothetical protein
MSWLIALLLAVSMSGATADAVARQARTPVRVHVFTAMTTGSPATDEEKGRIESVADLRDLLGKRRSEITIVGTADEAQVIVEVTDREERDAAAGGFGGIGVSRFRTTIVRVDVKAGDDRSSLKGLGQGSWSSAAKDAAERLRKWIVNHVKER